MQVIVFISEIYFVQTGTYYLLLIKLIKMFASLHCSMMAKNFTLHDRFYSALVVLFVWTVAIIKLL